MRKDRSAFRETTARVARRFSGEHGLKIGGFRETIRLFSGALAVCQSTIKQRLDETNVCVNALRDVHVTVGQVLFNPRQQPRGGSITDNEVGALRCKTAR